MGRICEKHHEFYEIECRWCDGATGPVLRSSAAPAYAGTYVPIASAINSAIRWQPQGECDHRHPGPCDVCGYDILPVASFTGPVTVKPQLVVIAEHKDEITLVLERILGPIEQIGPQESVWWREFYGGNRK